MTDSDEINEEMFFNRKRAPEEITAEWLSALKEIGMCSVELADYMKKKGGDYRPYASIYRGIQRMVSGESRVSGEMFVIVRMLLRQHRRLKMRHTDINWTYQQSGSLSAEIENYTVWLIPQTKGRFIVSCRSHDGYSPEFGRWQDNLSDAKNKALACVEEGMNDYAQAICDRNVECCNISKT